MTYKKILKKIIPNFILSKASDIKNSERVEKMKLNAVDKMDLLPDNLLHEKEINLNEIFNSSAIASAWGNQEKRLKKLSIPDLTGGVNLGDRKAIFYLIAHLEPKSVLEIGTHIGASTVHIASALNHNLNHKNIKSVFSTLDIRDVNCRKEKPWLQFGTEKSPAELLEELNLDMKVKFINQNSFRFFEDSQEKFDFIFLDGDHSAKTVYQEIPKALSKLNEGGVILLHDYFPNGKSPWPENIDLFSGPYLGTQRHIIEGAEVVVKPLGELPWPTKLNSNLTSLALLLKK
jgi:predicted O-methyltransferase YrrM